MKTHVIWKTDKKYSQYIYLKRSSYSEHIKGFYKPIERVQAKPSKNGKIKLHKRRYVKINMKTALTSPIFRKLRFKATIRNHWVSTGIKKPKHSKCSEDAE